MVQQAFNITCGHYSTCTETETHGLSSDLSFYGLKSISVRKVTQMYKHKTASVTTLYASSAEVKALYSKSHGSRRTRMKHWLV